MAVNKKKRAAVALSGGVDSSVTALIMQQRGYEVIGITGKMLYSPSADMVCQNAEKVAKKLGIEHKILDVSVNFKKRVIDYFNEAYTKGETPNPCAMCNITIKWGEIFDYAINELGADVFATGHYANLKKVGDYYQLFKAKDSLKDQLYFLFGLSQAQLAKTVFPLYEFEKSEIRQIATDNDLPSKSAKDSQDICFIAKPKLLKQYLYENLGRHNGDFIDFKTGKKRGEHNGCFQFTVGQRRGIGVAAENPLYVIKIDPKTNTVYIGEKSEALGNSLNLRDVEKSYPFECNSFDVVTKIRYNMSFVNAHVEISGNNAVMTFEEPVYSITPGQAAVWYDKEDGHLIGGGWICN